MKSNILFIAIFVIFMTIIQAEGCNRDGYEDEIPKSLGKYCYNHYDLPNLCDGTKYDCVSRGKDFCYDDPNCKGIMYHSGWASALKGVKICNSVRANHKPE